MTVLGAAGQTFGLGFFDSVEDHTETYESSEPELFSARARWSLFYGPISHLPFGDADLWEDHNLTVAGDDAYPLAVQFVPGRQPRRPDAGVLSSRRKVHAHDLPRFFGRLTEGVFDVPAMPGNVGTINISRLNLIALILNRLKGDHRQ